MTSEMRVDRSPGQSTAPAINTAAINTAAINTAAISTAAISSTGATSASSEFPGPLPDPIVAARSQGQPSAIRLACLWDTLERYATVRRRHDRLPAHHLVCSLADEVRRLADLDEFDGRHDWAAIAARLDGACGDPLGDDPLDAVTELVASIHDLTRATPD